MTLPNPFLKIRNDRFEVLQGSEYVPIDRSRVEAVHFHDGVLTVRYQERGGVELDCTKVEHGDLKALLHTLQSQRDRNHDAARAERKKNAIFTGLF